MDSQDHPLFFWHSIFSLSHCVSFSHTDKHKPKDLSNYPWNNLLDWYLNYATPCLCVILSHTHSSCPHSQLLNGCSMEEWGGMRWPCGFFSLAELLSVGLCLSDYFVSLWYFINLPFHIFLPKCVLNERSGWLMKLKKKVSGGNFVSWFTELFSEIQQKPPCVSRSVLPKALTQSKMQKNEVHWIRLIETVSTAKDTITQC